MSNNKLTLEKIAELAGVSRSTVSRVINEHPNVKPSVRKRVLKMVDETGYRPNPAARSLAKRRTGIIGLVIPYAVQFFFADPYIPRLIQGITQACNAHDYTLSLFLIHSMEEETKLYRKMFNNLLFDGVIVTASDIGSTLPARFVKHNLPFVMVGRPEDTDKISFVDVDNVVGAYTAVTHLIRIGYKRIATITGPANSTAAIDRKEGYLKALNDRGFAVDNKLIVESDYTEAGGYTAMQKLLSKNPQAVFAASDMMAFGALRALREAGLTVPNDIALIGFDDLSPATISNPPLTTIRQPVRRVGRHVVEVLLDILNNKLEPPRRIILPTELIIRASCGYNIN